ncbi:lectin-like domain-containing protein [Lactococcus allomyrinae]|uniref:WxL domain-containing protein n=1 Tax=Lactococcus allomyrinae TaxID=2419773 RepID=A0A387BHP7_9LACT|nr:hypothetical protein [Lactococcus allomyrinae]AYG00400.1 hypothetical protein D7I46_04420 [Lactococcus allomyrinae]
MIKFKDLLKKITVISVLTILVGGFLSPALSLIFSSYSVKAATGTPTTLLPNSNVDTGNHEFTRTDMDVAGNWTSFGRGGASPSWSAGALNIINDKASQAGGAIFNYGVDFSQSLILTGAFKVDLDWAYDYAAGDSLGFVLSKINAQNIVGGQTGGGLGVAGLPESIFAGRDFYYNSDYNDPDVGRGVDGILLPNVSNMIAIRETSSGGTLLPAPSSASASVNGANWQAGSILNWRNVYTDYVQLKWNPTSGVGANGRVSGRLTMTYGSGADASGNITGQTGQIFDDCELNQMLSIGVVGSTGGHWSKMSYLTSSGYLKSTKATQPIRVNYINSVTGQVIQSAPYTTIKANVGDKIGVVSPTSSAIASDDYDYRAPDLSSSGYTFSGVSTGSTVNTTSTSQVGTVLVSNNDSYTSTGLITPVNNTINVYYQPSTVSASFISVYLGGTPGTTAISTSTGTGIVYATPSLTPTSPGKAPTLTAIPSILGSIGTSVSAPTLNIPDGYSVYGVVGPDDKSYLISTYGSVTATLNAALNANPLTLATDVVPSGCTNQFTIIFQPKNHYVDFKYAYDSNTPGIGNEPGLAPPSLPTTVVTQQGVTGQPLVDPGLSYTPIGAGYQVRSILVAYPDGNYSVSGGQITISHVFDKWPYMSYVYKNQELNVADADLHFTYQVGAMPQSGTVNFKYAVGTPGTDHSGNPVLDAQGNPEAVTSDAQGTLGLASALPEALTLSGKTGGVLDFDPRPSIPEGYAIDTITGPDGTIYTSDDTSNDSILHSALENNPYFKDVSQSTNSFTITLKALPSKAMIQMKLSEGDIPEGITIPEEQSFQLSQGLVGSPISNSDISNAIATLTTGGGVLDTTSALYNNWYVTDLVGPHDDTIDTTGIQNNATAVTKLTDLIAHTPYILSSDSKNIYTINMSYSGTLSLEVPETISFGSHEISGESVDSRGALSSDVSVYDERSAPSSWSMTVQQTAALTAYNTTTGLIIPSLNLDGALHFIDNLGTDTVLTGTSAPTVYNQTVGENSLVNVLNANSTTGAGLYLNVNPRQQVSTWQGSAITFKGAVTWTILDAP